MKKAAGFGLAFFFFLATVSMVFSQENKPEKPWLLTQDQVNSIVNAVRAGKDLTPSAWPEGAKVAVALSFDFDAETNALRDGQHSPGILSQGDHVRTHAERRLLPYDSRQRPDGGADRQPLRPGY